MWIPQLAMSAGATLLAIALWDHLFRIIFTGSSGIAEPDPQEARD